MHVGNTLHVDIPESGKISVLSSGSIVIVFCVISYKSQQHLVLVVSSAWSSATNH